MWGRNWCALTFLGNLYARVCGRIYPAVQTQHTQGYCDDVLDLGQGEFRGDLAHHCVRIPIKDTRSFIKSYCLTRFWVFYERISRRVITFPQSVLSKNASAAGLPYLIFPVMLPCKNNKKTTVRVLLNLQHAEFNVPIKRWIWLLFVILFIKMLELFVRLFIHRINQYFQSRNCF